MKLHYTIIWWIAILFIQVFLYHTKGSQWNISSSLLHETAWKLLYDCACSLKYYSAVQYMKLLSKSNFTLPLKNSCFFILHDVHTDMSCEERIDLFIYSIDCMLCEKKVHLNLWWHQKQYTYVSIFLNTDYHACMHSNLFIVM